MIPMLLLNWRVWAALSIVAALAASHWKAYSHGGTVARAAFAEQEADRLEQEAEMRKLLAKRAEAASDGFEVDRARTRTEFLTITERVDHVIQAPVYRDVCFDADGLRALADAVGTTADTGEPGRAVPTPAPVK